MAAYDPFAFIEEEAGTITSSQELLLGPRSRFLNAPPSSSDDVDSGSSHDCHIPKHCGDPPIFMLSLSDSPSPPEPGTEKLGDMDADNGPKVATEIQSTADESVKANEENWQFPNIAGLIDVIKMIPEKPEPRLEGVDVLDIVKEKGIVFPKPRWWRGGYGLDENED